MRRLILRECLRGASLLVRRCEVGEEMFGDEVVGGG